MNYQAWYNQLVAGGYQGSYDDFIALIQAGDVVTYEAGMVTAYGAAVEGGYTGTYADFCTQQAQYAENAAYVADTMQALEHKLDAVTPGTEALLEQIEQAAASAPAELTAVTSSIASLYNGTATYKAGDYCFYNDSLYRCKTAIDTPEPDFVAAHWENAKMADDMQASVGDLKSALQRMPYRTTFDYTALTTGYIKTDGTIGANNGLLYTIRSCENLSKISLRTRFFDTVAVIFYDANDAPLTPYISAVPANHDYGEIVFPDNAVKYGVNSAGNDAGKEYFELVEYNGVGYAMSKIDTINDQLITSNTFNYTALSEGRIMADGTVASRTDSLHCIRSTSGVASLTVKTRYFDAVAIAYYDSSMNLLSYTPAIAGNTDYGSVTFPEGAAYYGVNCANNASGQAYFEMVETVYNLVSIRSALEAEINKTDGSVTAYNTKKSCAHLVLPSKVRAVVGMPIYLYYENMLDKGWLKDYTVSALANKSSPYGYLVDIDSAGNSERSIYVYDGETLLNTGSLLIIAVSPLSSSASAKVLMIGDSKTEATGKAVKLKSLIDADANMTVTFIGTRGNGTTVPKNEGYSGQSIISICQSATLNGITNPFYNAEIIGDNKFDFAQYCTTVGDTPDIVFIDFGANQTSANWTTVKACYDAVIASIKSVSSAIKIVICVQESQGLARTVAYRTGTKFAYGYKSASTYYSIPKMIDEYDEREDEGIYILPQYLSVDLYNDYPMADLPIDKYTSMTQRICVDVVHPGNNAGAWSQNTPYKYGQYVNRNGTYYAAKVDNTGADPETSSDVWSPILNPDSGYNKIASLYYVMLTHLVA